MSETKTFRPKARLPRGFRDRGPREIAAERAVVDTIRRTYESWGFEPLETPAFEYTEALGKFLPDLDRPNEGVFSLQDEDGQWMSLRYDLTAPLARYVAENFQNLPKPFRRYQTGSVWRNEKPGPGRFREFTQFDADTVGTNSPAADAELLMMLADTLDALGLKGNYAVKVNSRKFLNGILGLADVEPKKAGAVLRALDKFDRLGREGVEALLGKGRKDESGDFTQGAGLAADQIGKIMRVFTDDVDDLSTVAGFEELQAIQKIVRDAGYGKDRIAIDLSIVRGLEYYTGPVFEAQLTFPVTNEAGETVVFGSVAGGGRYDDLVARFTGQQVPATGISIGVSRLISALRDRAMAKEPLVVVLAVDKDNVSDSFAMARELRAGGVRAETYVGTKKFGDQLKYADRRGAAIAVIEGGDERAKGEVQLKDLALGSELAKNIESRAEWVKDRPAQKSVRRNELVAEVRKMLDRS
ncbi:MAG TPA: histidine--tRNA ligase [Rhizomicrobium sp.]|nr:histidine--tRNA ligase [Rhizomicrobium sp.]